MNQSLKMLTGEKCRELYGENAPAFVRNRLEEELESIERCGWEEHYLFAHKVVSPLREREIPFWLPGTVGCSFVAHLLGIVQCNPLPPHYRCPDCCTTVEAKEKTDGYDLPIKACPACGAMMHGDGHNLDFVWFAGLHGEKEPVFFAPLRTLERGRKVIEKAIADWPKVPVVFDNGDPAGWYFGSTEQAEDDDWAGEAEDAVSGGKARALRKEAVFRLNRRSTDYLSIALVENCTEPEWRIRDNTPVKSYFDLIKREGVKHMATEDGTSLTEEEKNLFFDRDAVMEYFLDKGYTKEDAYHIAEMTRKGVICSGRRGVEEYQAKYGGTFLQDEFLPAARKIQYLFPRSHSIEYNTFKQVVKWVY